jgi:hypothetical protein
MKLQEFYIIKEEIIEWDRFLMLLSQINVPWIKVDDIVYNRYDKDYEKVFIGGGDWEINESNFLIKDELKLMIGQNLNMISDRILAMPIGMPSFSHDKIIGNLDRIIEKNQDKKIIKNLCYIGFRDETYLSERSMVRKMFSEEIWTTTTVYDRTNEGHSSYIDNIYNHKFTLCPRGNGIDTHRIWESLYLRTIPIVKRCVAMKDFENLPILWIDDWQQVNSNFLEEKYFEIINKEYDFEKLTLSYYINKFLEV